MSSNTCPGCNSTYDSKQGRYPLCWSCGQERRAADLRNGQLVTCLYCDRTHSPAHPVCWSCRQTGRDADAAQLTLAVLTRDGFACATCRTHDATLRPRRLRQDRPAAPWNYQTACPACRTSEPLPGAYEAAVGLYATVLWGDLGDTEQQQLLGECAHLGADAPGLDAWLYSMCGPCTLCGRETHRYGPGARPVCSTCRGVASTGYERRMRLRYPVAVVTLSVDDDTLEAEIAAFIAAGSREEY